MLRIDFLLPDDVLLEIFDFYVNSPHYEAKTRAEAWQSLVHVCRRWRNLVFGSRRRLNMQLYCTPQTPAKDRLDIWPALPLLIMGSMVTSSGLGNVIAALGQSDRIREVTLVLTSWVLEKVVALMQVSFPELTDLRLSSYNETPVIPDSFLGGSAPRLQMLYLNYVPFLGLPKLLLSATQLVHLHLFGIPHSGYISPKAVVATLSALSSLNTLCLQFRSPQSRPDLESPGLLPPKRSVLPALNAFRFKGVTEYLEELVTRIDTPQLDQLDITFFNQIDFHCPRLAQFIYCTQALTALNEGHVHFDNRMASIRLRSPTSKISSGNFQIDISCREPDWQLSSIEQVCGSSFPPLPTVEDLYIEHQYSQQVWKDDAIENTLWMQLLLPFTTVKNLYLSKEFVPGIAAALQDLVGGGITEVLPSLQNILVEGLEPSGPGQGCIGRFVAARQLRVSNHPIAISVWDKDFDESGDTDSDDLNDPNLESR